MVKMTEGIIIVLITQLSALIAQFIDNRKTREANRKDNVKTKHEVKQLIKGKEDEELDKPQD